MADIDAEQNRVSKVLQDTCTGISEVDDLISQFLAQLVRMLFDDKTNGPDMLRPSTLPVYHTHKVLLSTADSTASACRDLTAEIIDSAWEAVR
jgi:hypothetical protein